MNYEKIKNKLEVTAVYFELRQLDIDTIKTKYLNDFELEKRNIKTIKDMRIDNKPINMVLLTSHLESYLNALLNLENLDTVVFIEKSLYEAFLREYGAHGSNILNKLDSDNNGLSIEIYEHVTGTCITESIRVIDNTSKNRITDITPVNRTTENTSFNKYTDKVVIVVLDEFKKRGLLLRKDGFLPSVSLKKNTSPFSASLDFVSNELGLVIIKGGTSHVIDYNNYNSETFIQYVCMEEYLTLNESQINKDYKFIPIKDISKMLKNASFLDVNMYAVLSNEMMRTVLEVGDMWNDDK